jgi:hypothetical protein
VANVHAIHSVGRSIVNLLEEAYPPTLKAAHPCAFTLLASGESVASSSRTAVLALRLYHISLRHEPRAVSHTPGSAAPLTLDLHFLLSVSASRAETEQTVLAWALFMLHQHPVLDAARLTPEGGWGPQDSVHLVPIEAPAPHALRARDPLEAPFHVGIPYLARAVRVDRGVDDRVDAFPKKPALSADGEPKG